MYESPPRHREGEPLEEVLDAAIRATATSSREEGLRRRLSASLPRGRTAARPPTTGEEPPMRVMRAGSPALRLPAGSDGLVLFFVSVAVVLALVVLVCLMLF